MTKDTTQEEYNNLALGAEFFWTCGRCGKHLVSAKFSAQVPGDTGLCEDCQQYYCDE